MSDIKLASVMSLAIIGQYKPRKGGEAFGAFQVSRARANFHGSMLRITLPDIHDAAGVCIGQGGRIAVGDGDWICKRGADYTVIKDEIFAQDYESA